MPESPAPSHPASRAAIIVAWALILVGAGAWIACFALTLGIFAGLEPGIAQLPAGPLDIPWATAGLVAFTVPVGVGTVILARHSAPNQPLPRRVAVGGFMVIAAIIGLWAAWALTADKVITLTTPQAQLDCNFSLLVQCGANLSSWQGSVFGFPNPLMGLAGWSAVLVMGTAIIAGAPLARWLWWLFTAGVTGALALVIWLITQSIFTLGTLCPWCMVTWSVTIPLFWLTWTHVLRGSRNGAVARAASAVHGWVPLITIASYIVVAVIAQLRLDVISYL